MTVEGQTFDILTPSSLVDFTGGIQPLGLESPRKGFNLIRQLKAARVEELDKRGDEGEHLQRFAGADHFIPQSLELRSVSVKRFEATLMMSLEALTASEKWPCRLTQSFTVGPISLQGRLIQPSLTEINFCKTRGYSDFAPGQTGCLRKRPSRLFISVKLVYSNFLPPNFLPFLLFLYLAFSGFGTLPERFFGDPTGTAGLGSSNHDDQPYYTIPVNNVEWAKKGRRAVRDQKTAHKLQLPSGAYDMLAALSHNYMIRYWVCVCANRLTATLGFNSKNFARCFVRWILVQQKSEVICVQELNPHSLCLRFFNTTYLLLVGASLSIRNIL
ncbi:hypothetical protein B0H14DRAFT_3633088 [Mycena olivaceomarginata]|nr:hypothetical protein B0H14DRAFT_3633088 [Mycena olivaceomarginata]